MPITSNDCGYDVIWICYDCGKSIKCVHDKLSITWDLLGIREILQNFW